MLERSDRNDRPRGGDNILSFDISNTNPFFTALDPRPRKIMSCSFSDYAISFNPLNVNAIALL
jgi:hypothetical protein